MTWYLKDDKTEGVITAKKHLKSKGHKDIEIKPLPKNAIIFCLSKWDKILQEEFGAELYLEKLKQFLGSTPVYKIPNVDDWCFLHGGPGAPLCADAVESIHALGVENIVLVGMVGGFGVDTQIGEVVVPNKILSTEGTSIHYVGRKKWAHNVQNKKLCQYLCKCGFAVSNKPTVSCDAVYRQTFAKESAWRDLGCVGVDCEGSAVLNVAKFLGIKAECIFVVSDKHPQTAKEQRDWHWGIDYDGRKKFISSLVKFYAIDKNN